MVPDEARYGTVARGALKCSDVVDGALCYIASAIFSKLHMMVENSQLYTLEDEELSG